MAKKMYYSPQEVADMFGMRRLTVYSWVRRGELEAFKIGKNIMIPVEGVDRFLEERRYKPKEEVTPGGVTIYHEDEPAGDLYEGRGWGDGEEHEDD